MKPQNPAVLMPGDVAKMFNVDQKTISRWAEIGLLPHFRTLGGHRRYYREDVEKLTRPEYSSKPLLTVVPDIPAV